MKLAGKHAIVTGGSSGIGAACAAALAAEGAAVLACARRFARAPAGAAPRAGEIATDHLDVTDEAEVEARFARVAELDVVVCSHGTGTFAPIARARASDLRDMLEVHITGTFLCARAALARMAPRRRGHIVIVGSHAALRAFPDCGGYTAAKAGQLGLARVLAEEARPLDVRVTTLMPGATDTPIWDDRPGFDRTKMMRPADVAELMLAIVTRPSIAVEEVIVTPPAGAL